VKSLQVVHKRIAKRFFLFKQLFHSPAACPVTKTKKLIKTEQSLIATPSKKQCIVLSA